jgi:hypothetical protein
MPVDKIRRDNDFPWSFAIMDYLVSYEHSPSSPPDDYIAKIPSPVVKDLPANIRRGLLPEYIDDLIRKRSARIGKIRHLRIL